MLNERSKIGIAVFIPALVLFFSLRHLKHEKSIQTSEIYQANLLLDLWTNLKNSKQEDVVEVKNTILSDLLRDQEATVRDIICESSSEQTSQAEEDNTQNCNKLLQNDSVDEETGPKQRAFQYLVTDFKSDNYKKENKNDYKPALLPKAICESNPELNNYIFKPQFSRDQYDYDVNRLGYQPRKLVCDEMAKHEVKIQSTYWLDKCDDVPPLGEIVTVIGRNISELTIENLTKLRIKGVNIMPEKAQTPYYLLLNSHFDFDGEDANLWRMIREAENQNADVVAGSWRNEQGQWKSSCLHFSLSNYTLDIWEGYYKSISSMKYCDFSFGPVLIRSHLLDKILKNSVDIISFHLENPHLRTIMCSDCMFYMSDEVKWETATLIPLVRRFSLTRIKLEDEIFDFTCPQADIKCDVKYFDSHGLAQPPCCLKVLTGMMMALVHEFDAKNASLCIYCGQVLATLKMPGGQLPWDTDVDAPMFASDFYHVIEDIMPGIVSYGLKPSINTGRHQKNEIGELEGGAITVKHMATGYTTDNYAKAPSKLKCGHNPRGRTFIKLDGIWVPGPDNPGKYGRTYGDEILRHVLHVKSSSNAYNDVQAVFKDCGAFPEHACLKHYPTDGNIQFRNDAHRLLPLS